MCNGKNSTVTPSDLDNFLITRKQTAELKPVAHLTDICSNKWPCYFFPLCDQRSDWSYDIGSDHCPKYPMVIATELWSKEQEAGDQPRGEVMGLGNSHIMQYIFFQVTTNIQSARFLPLHLSVPGKWLMWCIKWWDSGNVTPKTDLLMTPKSCSELCRGNLGSGLWPAITEDGDVHPSFSWRYLVQIKVHPLSSNFLN